jgi:hypothetical protein
MEVYLLRTSLSAEGGSHLSLEGRQIIRAVGNKLRLTEEPSFDAFVTSPHPAAVQTAELFADRTDYIGLVETMAALGEPTSSWGGDKRGATPASVIVPALLSRGSTIVVVADEPLLATIGAFLVGRPTFPPAIPAQVSVIKDRHPAWCLKPGELTKSQLLVA